MRFLNLRRANFGTQNLILCRWLKCWVIFGVSTALPVHPFSCHWPCLCCIHNITPIYTANYLRCTLKPAEFVVNTNKKVTMSNKQRHKLCTSGCCWSRIRTPGSPDPRVAISSSPRCPYFFSKYSLFFSPSSGSNFMCWVRDVEKSSRKSEWDNSSSGVALHTCWPTNSKTSAT